VQSIGIQPLKYIPISKNSLDQIGLSVCLTLYINLTFVTFLLIALTFQIPNDSRVKKGNFVRFVLSITFLDDERDVWIIPLPKIVGRSEP